MAIPLFLSSGALSMAAESLNLASFLSLFASTLVMAAVRVVLPWSTCPIVPMLQWGLSLLNTSFSPSALVVAMLLAGRFQAVIAHRKPCLEHSAGSLKASKLILPLVEVNQAIKAWSGGDVP